jgi:selenocysteine lyase/cysteine desulfurase
MLAVEAERHICELSGMPSLYSNDAWYAQMVAMTLPVGTDLDALKHRLYEEFRIEVPLMQWNKSKILRISIQAYNSQSDIQRLQDALRTLL